MKQRLLRLELGASKKRQLALEAMTEAGLKRLEQPDFTASPALERRFVVVAEDRSPKPIGCRSRRSSIANPCSLISSAAARCLAPNSATPNHTSREDQVMAFTEAQVEPRAKLDSKHVKTRKVQEPIFTMSKGGTSSRRQIASSGMTLGIGERWPATACGAGPLAPITAQPTSPRSA